MLERSRPESRKIDAINLSPLRGWRYDDRPPAFGRGWVLTALTGLFIHTIRGLFIFFARERVG